MPIPKDKIQDIADEYMAGTQAYKVAQKYGCSNTSVYHIVERIYGARPGKSHDDQLYRVVFPAVRDYMQAHRLSFKRFANIVHVNSPVTLKRHLTDCPGKISLNEINAIARVMKVPVGTVLRKEDDKRC